ncbi:hypothetical protein MUO69_01365 [Candidatus Bathyarchaeota archaeon]|nr:hypothetical protein [Candidatus Bathyarchaeota archaeon]
MQTKTLSAIKKLDFHFENSPRRIVANRNCPEINLVGLSIGPLEEGNDYEIHYWVAAELEKSGIAHFREDEKLSMNRLNKIQWTERVQTVGQMSKLPDEFYPKLRRLISELENEPNKGSEKIVELEKTRHLARDIVNSRLRKIISIASAPAQTEQILKNLTGEERFLYGRLYRFINEWRTQILEEGSVEE